MKDEIKQRWISKLKSGDYSQTTGRLTDDTGYCCLGILCEIAVEDGIVFKSQHEEANTTFYVSKLDETDRDYSVLPDAVKEWAGLDSTNPDVKGFNKEYPDDMDDLAELNDNGMTFAEIAELIDKSL